MIGRLAALNLGAAALGIVLAGALGRALVDSRPLPGPPEPPPARAATIAPAGTTEAAARERSPAGEHPSPRDESSALAAIASRNLFDPSRGAAGEAARAPGGRPRLYGVVAGEGVESRAYVEDPVTKAIRSHRIGDTVAGWRLDQIREDRVVIASPGRERVEVLLRDPGQSRSPTGPAPMGVTAGRPAARAEAMAGEPVGSLQPPALLASPDGAARAGAAPGVGAIPPQLFRPAQAGPAAPEPTEEDEE